MFTRLFTGFQRTSTPLGGSHSAERLGRSPPAVFCTEGARAGEVGGGSVAGDFARRLPPCGWNHWQSLTARISVRWLGRSLALPGLHPSVHRIPENFDAIGWYYASKVAQQNTRQGGANATIAGFAAGSWLLAAFAGLSLPSLAKLKIIREICARRMQISAGLTEKRA